MGHARLHGPGASQDFRHKNKVLAEFDPDNAIPRSIHNPLPLRLQYLLSNASRVSRSTVSLSPSMSAAAMICIAGRALAKVLMVRSRSSGRSMYSSIFLADEFVLNISDFCHIVLQSPVKKVMSHERTESTHCGIRKGNPTSRANIEQKKQTQLTLLITCHSSLITFCRVPVPHCLWDFLQIFPIVSEVEWRIPGLPTARRPQGSVNLPTAPAQVLWKKAFPGY